MPLKIGRGDVGHIHEHAKEAYPEECAGALVGMDVGEMKLVVDVWRAQNTHEEERSRRFLIEPLQVKEFEERARERDMDLLGFYHSHPDIRPRPQNSTASTAGLTTRTLSPPSGKTGSRGCARWCSRTTGPATKKRRS